MAARMSAIQKAALNSGLLPATLSIGGIALITSLGWVLERRRHRRDREPPRWANIWPDVRPVSAARPVSRSSRNLGDILPEGRSPAEAARAIFVTPVGETTSRREATMIDLHELDQKLRRRCRGGDPMAALLLLQQHIVDFRYTSPWVFLELLYVYKRLGLQEEWESARLVFRDRFGQNAPTWSAPTTAHVGLETDPQLASQLTSLWPTWPARMLILRWMLGEPDMRARSMGPPLLPLGIYRDFILADDVLDEVMAMAARAGQTKATGRLQTTAA